MSIKVIIRRFLELLIICVALSAIAVALNKIEGVFTTRTGAFLLSFIGAIIFYVVNVILLRRCYFDLRNKTAYFINNFIAYAVFGIVRVIVYFAFSKDVYGWMFAITKFTRYTTLAFPTHLATAIFHIISGIVILLAWIGMDWIFLVEEPAEDNEQSEESSLVIEDDE